MTDMQALTGRVRELDQCLELFLVRAVLGLKALLLVPDVLPLLFYLFMIVLQRIFPLKCFIQKRDNAADTVYARRRLSIFYLSSMPSSSSDTGVPSFHRFSRL